MRPRPLFVLEREICVRHALTQMLVRSGFGDAADAHAGLEADERHEPSAFVQCLRDDTDPHRGCRARPSRTPPGPAAGRWGD